LTGATIIGVGYPEGAPEAVAATTDENINTIPARIVFIKPLSLLILRESASFVDVIAPVRARHLPHRVTLRLKDPQAAALQRWAALAPVSSTTDSKLQV
jgi:hypothetical protein